MISSSSRLASRELVADAAPIVAAQLLGLHQLVDVGAIAGIGGNAAGRRVRLHQVAAGLELGHLVANRRRADAEVVLLGKRLRADRLGGRDVFVDDRREDIGLALVEAAARLSRPLL